ncbi:PAS domain S-box protein [Sphingomonas sp. RT2P30]|uniref:PAS domain S-box protein n=1 Tax=Parasphingomonas halimpatiens TaxID=3096162 RepID=UPI002FC6CA9F
MIRGATTIRIGQSGPAFVASSAAVGLAALGFDAASRGSSLLIAPAAAAMAIAVGGWVVGRRASPARVAPEELHAAFDATSIALTLRDGVITHWSRGCEALYGWGADEVIGRDKYDLLGSRLRDVAASPIFDPDELERELTERRKDGTTIDVIERRSLLAPIDGKQHVALVMIDISDRVRAENALRESEARLATAMAARGIAVAHWDLGDGLEWSGDSEGLLGYPKGSIPDFAAWAALIDPDDLRATMEIIADAAARQAERLEVRYRMRGAKGDTRWIEGAASPLYDTEGKLESVVGAVVDVTDRVERNAALAAREAQLRSVLDAAPEAIVVVDSVGTIVEFNPAAERIWGYAAADVIGRSGLPLVAPQDHERWLEVISRDPGPVEGGAPRPAPSTGSAVARDGRVFAVELEYGYAHTPAGTLVTVFCRDIAEQIATERRFAELGAELAHVSRQSAMSELAADLAHELNQPLSATVNFLATARILIAQGGELARIGDLLRLGEEQTLRSGAIIRRLRDFLQKRESEMRVESVNEIVRESVGLVLFGSAQHEIELIYALDPAVDRVLADRIQIQQVVVNLVRNAMDALRQQPLKTREIVITSRAADEGLVEIAVSDTGQGLPEAFGEQIHARFATSKSGTAMGIGLSISRRIIEAHGGTLVAENRARGGATFRFTLPLFEEVDE